MVITYQEYTEDVVPTLNFPTERSYELSMNLALSEIGKSPLLQNLKSILTDAAQKYSPQRPHLLFGGTISDTEFGIKEYASVLNKTYRKNVIYNRRYPDPPKAGFIQGAGIYTAINDLVRARLVCKYMDGPPFVCGALAEFCDAHGIAYNTKAMSTERGYHAWHFYAKHHVEFLDGNHVVEREVWIEIQVTTQLAEVLMNLTHDLYETDRILPKEMIDDSWKWNPESAKFRSTYMGHTLHLLEGVILTLKNEQRIPAQEIE